MKKSFGALSAGSLAALLMTMTPTQVLAASADAESIKALEKKLERSLQMIDELSAKVRQLEQAGALTRITPPAAAPVVALVQPERVDELERQITQLTSGLSRRSDDAGLPIHGFADVGARRSTEDNVVAGRQKRGFNVGSFDLYMTPQFSDRVKALIELNFEVGEEGGVNTDLERLQLGYIFSDVATGWLGRFHTPYGYWNTAFHHGAQIQTAISRPKFLDFEDKGGILPAHTVGAWLTGTLPLDAGKLGYDVYVGNAPAINGTATASNLGAANPAGFSPAVNAGTYAGSGILDFQMAGATTHHSSTGFNLWFEPKSWAGLRLGIHGLRATVVDDSSDVNRTGLRMLGAYGVFNNDHWEVMGEYYGFHNKDITGATGNHNSSAGYLQIGYLSGRYTPYVRFEGSNLDQKDNYFAVQESGRSYHRQSVGVRYDVDPKAAVKLEVGRDRKTDLGVEGDSYTDASLQYSIRF